MRVPARTAGAPEIADAVRDLATGGTNAGGSLTLDPGAATTTVQAPLCAAGVMVMLSPRSASAGATAWWISAVGKGWFTVGHDSTAATDRTFDFELRRR